jgi:hypothetical protein
MQLRLHPPCLQMCGLNLNTDVVCAVLFTAPNWISINCYVCVPKFDDITYQNTSSFNSYASYCFRNTSITLKSSTHISMQNAIVFMRQCGFCVHTERSEGDVVSQIQALIDAITCAYLLAHKSRLEGGVEVIVLEGGFHPSDMSPQPHVQKGLHYSKTLRHLNSMRKRNKEFSQHSETWNWCKPVVPKVCSADPKGSATSSQGIRGYISVMATWKVLCYFHRAFLQFTNYTPTKCTIFTLYSLFFNPYTCFGLY